MPSLCRPAAASTSSTKERTAPPTEVLPLYQHPGIELIYMLDGKMEYGAGTARYVLGPGDALQFEGEVPHGPVGLLDPPVRFLSIKGFETHQGRRNRSTR